MAKDIKVRLRPDSDDEEVPDLTNLIVLMLKIRRDHEARGIRYVDSEGSPLPPLGTPRPDRNETTQQEDDAATKG